MTQRKGTAIESWSWQEAAADPDVQALVKAWGAYRVAEAAARTVVAHRVALVINKFGEPRTRLIIQKILRIKSSRAKELVTWGQYYLKVPNNDVWRVTDLKGVIMLAGAKPAVRKKMIAIVLKLAASMAPTGSTMVDKCFIATKLAELGDPEAANALANTRREKKATSDKLKLAALKEMRDTVARHPFLQQEITPETLEVLRGLPR